MKSFSEDQNNENLFTEPVEEEIELCIETLLSHHGQQMRWLKFQDHPCRMSHEIVRSLFLEAIDLSKTKDKKLDKEAGDKIEQAISIIKKEKIQLSYKDWCLVLKMQAAPGNFYPINASFAGIKGSKLLTQWKKEHPFDLNFIMACVFSGFENQLMPGYEQLYYTVAKTKSKRNTYFKENSIVFEEIYLPYHVVFAAIRKALPQSMYAKTVKDSDCYVKPGMVGYPNVWALYSWDDFTMQYKRLFVSFAKDFGRDLDPTDIIIAALTQSNKYHGLQLMNKNDCQVLNDWVESLPDQYKIKIDAFENSKWVKVDEQEIQY